MAAKVEIDVVARGTRQAAREIGNVGDAAEHTGDSLDGLGKDAHSLDRHIGDLTVSVTDLRKNLAADPGDKGLRKQLRDTERDLRFFTKLKNDVESVGKTGIAIGSQLGEGISTGLGDTLGALPSQLKGAAIVAGAGLGVLMAAEIGAAIGGAIIGGAGLGGIAGGILLASKDPTVAAAAQDLGKNVLRHFTEAAQPFERPLLDTFDRLDGTAARFGGNLRKDFSSLAPLLKPLTDGAFGFVDQLGPGIHDLVEASKPIIRIAATELPKLGHAVSVAFSEIADGADGGAMALYQTLRVLEELIIAGGAFVGFLEDSYEWMVKFESGAGHAAESAGKWLAVINPSILLLTSNMGDAADAADRQMEALKRGKDTANDFAGSLANISTEGGALDQVLSDINDEMERLFRVQMNLDEATDRYQEGLIKLKEELKQGRHTLAGNSQAAIDHRQAVRDEIDAIEAVRKAELDHGATLVEADKHYQEHIDQLRNTLIQLGYNKAEIDAIIASYKALNQLPPTTLKVNVEYHMPTSGIGASGSASSPGSAGYVAPSAPAPDDRFSRYGGTRAGGGPMESGLAYRAAEHGIELAVVGTRAQMLSMQETKAMLGGGGGWSGSPSLNLVVSARPGTDQDLVNWLLPRMQIEIVNRGGNVQEHLGDPELAYA